MSHESADQILERLARQDRTALDSKIVAGVDGEIAREHAISEAGILAENAHRLGHLMVGLDARQDLLFRGFFRRHNEDKAVQFYLGQKIYRNPFKADGIDSIFYEGLKTPFFGIDSTFEVEEHHFDVGWQINIVTASIFRAIKTKHEWQEKPMGICRVTRERLSRKTHGELFYNINIDTGNITSFTGGKKDDQLLTLGKQASAHALSLVNEAIDVLE